MPRTLGFSLADEVYRRLPNDTDFTEWHLAGFSGMTMAFFDGSAAYHTSADSTTTSTALGCNTSARSR